LTGRNKPDQQLRHPAQTQYLLHNNNKLGVGASAKEVSKDRYNRVGLMTAAITSSHPNSERLVKMESKTTSIGTNHNPNGVQLTDLEQSFEMQ